MQPEEEVALDLFLGLVEQLIRSQSVKVGQEVTEIRQKSANGLVIFAEESWLKLDYLQTELTPICAIEAKRHDVPQKNHSLILPHKHLVNHSIPEEVTIEELARGLDVALDLCSIFIVLGELLVVTGGQRER